MEGRQVKVTVPLLSTGNLGDIGLSSRDNFERFKLAVTSQKWLDRLSPVTLDTFLYKYGVNIKNYFFDYFLMGEENGWNNQSPQITDKNIANFCFPLTIILSRLYVIIVMHIFF